jgi:hypothetical protein
MRAHPAGSFGHERKVLLYDDHSFVPDASELADLIPLDFSLPKI